MGGDEGSDQIGPVDNLELSNGHCGPRYTEALKKRSEWSTTRAQELPSASK